MQELEDYEDQIKQLQDHNRLLKRKLEESQGVNVKQMETITTWEQQLKDFQFVSVGSSFSKFIEEEFRQLASRIQNDLHQLMVKLFEGLNEMQETYNAFELQ